MLRFLTPLLMTAVACLAQSPSPATPSQPLPTSEFRLWEKDAPGALGQAAKDIPTLTPYFPAPEKATGAAMIICPGGGYAKLSPHEGVDYARWLNEQGIAGFVLKYRLGSNGYRHPAMWQDVTRALRTVRANAAAWKLDPARIGIIGSSAGGHLAATLLTHYDQGNTAASDPIERVSSRPDLGVLCYAVITMGEDTHGGSRKNLLGDKPDLALIEELSNEQHVTKDTPPVFLFHTVEDQTVKVENTLNFAAALRRNGVSFSMHIYPKGHHGLGLGSPKWDPSKRHPWTTECALWLKDMGFGR